ncbi:heterokaryon incompatibility protein-domain-containing protein [Lasiosphaeria ovina]|uniref:Heterokaryon incompatibility protein-domain-containing protein n=1 Tax=Lasiosphaeria ovina TaxID=92902 RepID=A0AAE0MZ19_9PEZI|nr:heterokaryon incompatibility protein-domain-containing protein [Lasiosphaeria ovina]KAK3365369.1 heterokaryon incompatibility protein-domain-containing protein [Lasiosphaeria ovina]
MFVKGHGRNSIAMARRWFDKCEFGHHDCRRETSTSFSPTRLVKISGGRQRLVLSKSLNRPVQSATLSHCWGNIAIHRLLQDNISTFLQDIPADSLCRTFLDAIVIARPLGLHYLWIDSLCIVQDDPADWRRESAAMCDVYTHASLNIAATSARDGSEGCFMNKDNNYLAAHCIAIGQERFMCANSSLYAHNVLDTPLGSRAWVVQERLLAARTIHFGKNQLFWTCQDRIACEAYPERLPGGLVREVDHPSLETEASWREVVAQYSGCELTQSSDKLVAISGLAKRVAQYRPEDQYVAGLWFESLHVDLCWKVGRPEPLPPPPGPYQAPSWSWAALNQRVIFPAEPSSNWAPLMTALQVQTDRVGDDLYGALENAALWVKSGFFLKTRIPKRSQDAKAQRFGESSVSMVIAWDYVSDGTSEFYFCPVLQDVTRSQTQGFVLVATLGEAGEYRRVGHFKEVVEGWPYERLDIVDARVGECLECEPQPGDYVDGFEKGGVDLPGVIKLV